MDRLTGPQFRTLGSVGSAETAETAVDILFRHHYPSLLRTAYALLGTREGAEDAVQDAFVSLYRHWGRLRDPGAVEAYVRSAVLNRCRSGIRSRVRDRSLVDLHVVPLHTEGSDTTAVANEEARQVGLALRKASGAASGRWWRVATSWSCPWRRPRRSSVSVAAQ